MGVTYNLCFWNVRGLGDKGKCGDVLSELLSSSPHLVLLQETKLTDPDLSKIYSFLPRLLDSFRFSNAVGASGWILTAWP